MGANSRSCQLCKLTPVQEIILILTTQWHANAQAALNRGSGHLLSFNEPDNSGQSNISPQVAAAAYKQYMMPYAGHAALGAPAVTNSETGLSGLTWLTDVLEAGTGCEVDFVPIHWYGTDINDFKDHVQKAFTTGQYAAGGVRPIWITEVGLFFFISSLPVCLSF